MTAARALCLAMAGVGWAGEAGAQPQASIQASGVVRVCDPDGSNLDSGGDSYYREGDQFLATPTSGFNTSFSCLGRPQTFSAFTTADPDGDEHFGWRMVSQTSIAVTAEPEFTEIYGDSQLTTPMCLASPELQGRSPCTPGRPGGGTCPTTAWTTSGRPWVAAPVLASAAGFRGSARQAS